MRKLLTASLLLCFLLSCRRASVEKPAPEPVPVPVVRPAAKPTAILQTGGQPLWFQLTEDGPVHIESITDAVNTAAFVPWPLALHVRFFLEKEDGLYLAINRDGFMKLAPNDGTAPGLAMYRFSGGEFWRQYTVGGFVFYDDKPAAILYLDDRFLDSAYPLPKPRAWTFNMDSNTPFPLDIPALQLFPAEEGWDVDTLRLGHDGFWYLRAAKRSGPVQEVRMLRSKNLAEPGEIISLEVFQNSVPQETERTYSRLPQLPEGFFYTGTAAAGNSLFAFWEEQENFFIGAAGFVVIKR